jgi:hypothetical protein
MFYSVLALITLVYIKSYATYAIETSTASNELRL